MSVHACAHTHMHIHVLTPTLMSTSLRNRIWPHNSQFPKLNVTISVDICSALSTWLPSSLITLLSFLHLGALCLISEVYVLHKDLLMLNCIFYPKTFCISHLVLQRYILLTMQLAITFFHCFEDIFYSFGF